MNEKKLLVIAPSFGVDCTFNLIVADTGEILFSHWCSHEGYAKSDLYERREDRKKDIFKRFGEVDVIPLHRSFIPEEEMLKRVNDFYSLEK